MSSLFPFAVGGDGSGSSARPPKRKMSGAAVAIARDLHQASGTNTHGWLCALCRGVDVREVLAFAGWKLLVLLVVVLAVGDWVFFFKRVVEPRDVRGGALWCVLTLALLSFRRAVRARCGADVRALADHLEIFIAVSLAMVFSTNIAFYLHAPASAPLRDLGFMLVPEQALDSKWRPLSDVLTAVVPVLGLLQTLFMTRANRCRVIATFFRVASVSYALRMLTVSLTSLPGPAPHCRKGSALYAPPLTWIDIVTRVGPMYGQFNSCGDLIFSGHMAYTNSALLLYLRTMDRHFPRFSRLRWLAGGAFLLTLATLCVAGRKHYSVDVVLGVVISSLVYFHFEYSWVPACVHAHHAQLQQVGVGLAGSRRALTHPFGPVAPFHSAKASDCEVFDDVAIDDLELQRGPGEASDALLFRVGNSQQQATTAVDFVC